MKPRAWFHKVKDTSKTCIRKIRKLRNITKVEISHGYRKEESWRERGGERGVGGEIGVGGKRGGERENLRYL